MPGWRTTYFEIQRILPLGAWWPRSCLAEGFQWVEHQAATSIVTFQVALCSNLLKPEISNVWRLQKKRHDASGEKANRNDKTKNSGTKTGYSSNHENINRKFETACFSMESPISARSCAVEAPSSTVLRLPWPFDFFGLVSNILSHPFSSQRKVLLYWLRKQIDNLKTIIFYRWEGTTVKI